MVRIFRFVAPGQAPKRDPMTGLDVVAYIVDEIPGVVVRIPEVRG